VTVELLYRTLDQELVAILRRASLECPVCGEFLLHRADGIGCPQCGLEMPFGLEMPCGFEVQGEAAAVGRLVELPAV
jgi:ribosomal protein S27AE